MEDGKPQGLCSTQVVRPIVPAMTLSIRPAARTMTLAIRPAKRPAVDDGDNNGANRAKTGEAE